MVEPPSRRGKTTYEWTRSDPLIYESSRYMYDCVQGAGSVEHVDGATAAPFDDTYRPSLAPHGTAIEPLPERVNDLYGLAHHDEAAPKRIAAPPSQSDPLTGEELALLQTIRAREAGAENVVEYQTLCDEAGERLRHVLEPPLPHGAKRWAHESNFSPWNLPDYDYGKRSLFRGDSLGFIREAKDRVDASRLLYSQQRNRDYESQTVLTHNLDRVEETLAKKFGITNYTTRPPLADPLAKLMRDRNDALDAMKKLIERKGGTRYLARRLEAEGGLNNTVGPDALRKLLAELGVPHSEELASALLEDASRLYLETPKARAEASLGGVGGLPGTLPPPPGSGLSMVAPTDFARLVATDAIKFQKPARLDPLAEETRHARNCLNGPHQPLGETSRFFPKEEALANAATVPPKRITQPMDRLGTYDVVHGSYHHHPVRGLGEMRQPSYVTPFATIVDIDSDRANLAATTKAPKMGFEAALAAAADGAATISREAYAEVVRSTATGVKPSDREVHEAVNRADASATGSVSVDRARAAVARGHAPEFLKPARQRRSEEGRAWDWDPEMDRAMREEGSAALRAHFKDCEPGVQPPPPATIVPGGHLKRNLDATLPVYALCTAKGKRGFSSVPIGEMYGSEGFPRPVVGDGPSWPTKPFTKYGPGAYEVHMEPYPGVPRYPLSVPTPVPSR